MRQKSMKMVMCAAAAVFTFSGMNINAGAAGVSSVLPSAGVEYALATNATSLKGMKEEVEIPRER